MSITQPSAAAREMAAARLAGLATPPGALGRLGELGVWLAACQDQVPPRPVTNARLVIFAGDRGVAHHLGDRERGKGHPSHDLGR